MADTDQQAQAPAPAPQLTIADLLLTAQIITASANRGLFKPEEFKTVGDFYERLLAFLEGSGAITRTAAAGETAAPASTEEPTQAPQEKTNAKTRRKA
jgi:hypothetical protein